MSNMRRTAFVVLVLASAACAVHEPTNPSLSISPDEARTDLEAMEKDPKPLRRPLLVLGGYLDPIGAMWLADQLGAYVDDERIHDLDFFFTFTFDEAREDVILFVDELYPGDDPVWTTEVDVVALSLGGVVARYAAAPGERRLRIARLFTIASPHRGAALAELPSFDPMHLELRGDSAFMKQLNAAYPDADYELFPYVAIDDVVVGERNAAPPGERPWWVSVSFISWSHAAAALDPRIQADIVRRLRGEPAHATLPRAPFP